MKKNNVLTRMYFFISFAFVCIIFFFIVDRELSYYGKQWFNIYKPLPYNLVLDESYTYRNRLVFKDEYNGFSFIDHDDSHMLNDSTYVTYEKIEDYSFNRSEILANVIDSRGVQYSVHIFKAPNPRFRNHCKYKFYNKGEKEIDSKRHIYLDSAEVLRIDIIFLIIQLCLVVLFIVFSIFAIILFINFYIEEYVK